MPHSSWSKSTSAALTASTICGVRVSMIALVRPEVIAIGSQAALAATIYYIIHHIIVQTTLFLATGLVERVGGTTSINRLGGVLRASPFVSVLFFIGAMNLGTPLGKLLGHLDHVFAFGVRIPPGDSRVNISRGYNDRRTIAICVIQRAHRVSRSG